MSEETPPVTPENEEPPKKKKNRGNDPTPERKRKVGFRLKMALLEVIERKRLSDRVDYKAICARHGLSCQSLRKTYSLFTQGCIDLGDPTTPQEHAIDARMQHEKTMELLKRYKALILNGFEGALFRAEDALTNGEVDSWKKQGLPPMLRELESIIRLQAYNEKGYASILEEMMALRQREEKKLPNDPVVETKIITASDEDRALQILRHAKRVPESPPPAVSAQNGAGTGVDAGE